MKTNELLIEICQFIATSHEETRGDIASLLEYFSEQIEIIGLEKINQKLASKTDWYYTEKGEFPTEHETVIDDDENIVEYCYGKWQIVSTREVIQVKAWTYLPKFKDNV